MEIDHDISFTVIFLLPLIQEGTSESICTIAVDCDVKHQTKQNYIKKVLNALLYLWPF